MNTKSARFLTFILKEKTKALFAFAFYFLFITLYIDLSPVLTTLCFIATMIIILFVYPFYMIEWLDKTDNRIGGKLSKYLIQEIRKIAKEILMYIPILIISICITFLFMIGVPDNQTSIISSFNEAPIFNLINIVILGPIMEELIFRFLPYRFIKNKLLYVVFSAFIFAGMHVLNDPNPFYYIWFYMMRPLYYGYRYYETQDILVPISMHSLNNLIATLPLVFSYL